MSKRFVCRLVNPVTIVGITILWSLFILPLLSLIINGGFTVFALVIFCPGIILLAPFAIGALFNRIIITEDSIILRRAFKKNATAKIIDVKKINALKKIEKYGGFRNYEQKLSRIYFINSDNKILVEFYLPGWKIEKKVDKIKEQLKGRGCKGLVVAHIEKAE